MLLVSIRFREQAHTEEVLEFSAKVKNPLEAIQSFYDQHPNAIWVGVRSIPFCEEAV